MARGDHLVLRRAAYSHHGLDAGDGTVIHYSGTPLRLHDAKIERVPYAEFAGDDVPQVIPHQTPADLVLERAQSRLGEKKYNLLTNNCEHFVRWCVEGEGRSPQVKTAAVVSSIAAVTAIAFWRCGIRKPNRR